MQVKITSKLTSSLRFYVYSYLLYRFLVESNSEIYSLDSKYFVEEVTPCYWISHITEWQMASHVYC